jgi:hypothetical protein
MKAAKSIHASLWFSIDAQNTERHVEPFKTVKRPSFASHAVPACTQGGRYGASNSKEKQSCGVYTSTTGYSIQICFAAFPKPPRPHFSQRTAAFALPAKTG